MGTVGPGQLKRILQGSGKCKTSDMVFHGQLCTGYCPFALNHSGPMQKSILHREDDSGP